MRIKEKMSKSCMGCLQVQTYRFFRLIVCLFICLFCSIFILLSQESDDAAIFWTNPHPLRSCPFPSFPVILFLWLLTT